jgi:hypothetical protein
MTASGEKNFKVQDAFPADCDFLQARSKTGLANIVSKLMCLDRMLPLLAGSTFMELNRLIASESFP